MWFETLMGFREETPDQVRKNISFDGTNLKSNVNSREFVCGALEIPTLAELRTQVLSRNFSVGKISVREEIADVQKLHMDPSNAGALFQVASQFNLLEMIGPGKTPEDGVGIYQNDNTQGPACAIAAGAGTIYRNYFLDVNGHTGQTSGNQIDCLADIGVALGNEDNRLWEMKNGYAMVSKTGLEEISETIQSATEIEVDKLRALLRIGIQWNTEVTLNNAGHKVSQVYCSALPVAYSHKPAELWSEFAGLVLEATYEASLCAGILNSLETGNKRVYLTMVGGDAFGNKNAWITSAIGRALSRYNGFDLEVVIVSYNGSNEYIQEIVREFSG